MAWQRHEGKIEKSYLSLKLVFRDIFFSFSYSGRRILYAPDFIQALYITFKELAMSCVLMI